MKNIIIGLILGFSFNCLFVYASEKVVANPFIKLSNDFSNNLQTTKVTTEEGKYRVFVVKCGYGLAMTVIKIN